MAHLNLRDRLIEATIAYVGLPATTTTSLDRLRAGSDVETKLSVAQLDGAPVAELSWRAGRPALEDHELRIRVLIAEEGPASRLVRTAADADGVVFVVSASRARLAENATLRAELQQLGTRPVVVQLDALGAPDAVPLDELVGALALGGWPCVSPVDGKDAALAAVELAADTVVRALAVEPTPDDARADANPLLTALREAISSTLVATVAALEDRLVQRLGARSDGAIAGVGARLDGVAAKLTSMTERVAALAPRIAAIEASLRDAAATPLASQAAIVALREQVDALTTIVQRGAADAAETRNVALKSVARLDALDRSLSRAVDTGVAKLERVTLTSTEPLGKLVATAGELPATISALEARNTERLAAIERAAKASIDPLGKMLVRVGEFPAALADIDERNDARVARLEAVIRGAAEQTDARSLGIAKALEDLLEDLRNKKKGWFG